MRVLRLAPMCWVVPQDRRPGGLCLKRGHFMQQLFGLDKQPALLALGLG